MHVYINSIHLFLLGITPLHLAAELADSHSLIELLLFQPNI